MSGTSLGRVLKIQRKALQGVIGYIQSLLQQLKPGGRLFAVVGDAPVMEARLVTCIAANSYQAVDLFETHLAPLKNAAQPKRSRR